MLDTHNSAKTSTWQCPSNIAIIKYWGKHGLQLPQNPSFSFTLEKAKTISKVLYSFLHESQERKIEVFLDGKLQPTFVPKIEEFITRIEKDYPVLKNIHLKLETHNTFPHSSGIASSASAMSALACCFGEILGFSDNVQEVSRVARLGSGSASRSLFKHGAVWGQFGSLPGSTDQFAIPMTERLHPVFKSFRDAILVIKKGEKAVSSTAGHNLMTSHPFAKARYANARKRMAQLIPALGQGDVAIFGKICEQEALELHALMMCSDPPYILLESQTLSVINEIYQFRKDTNISAYFTLDAGPNIHLLYPEGDKKQVQNFITSNLVCFCEQGLWIDDNVGLASSKILS